MKKIFITGTDTDVGKSYFSATLMQSMQRKGLQVTGTKPIASGGEYLDTGLLVNKDALLLQKISSFTRPYHEVNPFVFKQAIAPHIAAQNDSRTLTVDLVCDRLARLDTNRADMHVIEGAGGWYVPLNECALYSDIVVQMKLPVIMVVGMRLGCLNHAILTHRAIVTSGAPLIGWVANCIDPHMIAKEQNINTLLQFIDSPCLGVLPYNQMKSSLDEEQEHEENDHMIHSIDSIADHVLAWFESLKTTPPV